MQLETRPLVIDPDPEMMMFGILFWPEMSVVISEQQKLIHVLRNALF
jgi:hypothetical protein